MEVGFQICASEQRPGPAQHGPSSPAALGWTPAQASSSDCPGQECVCVCVCKAGPSTASRLCSGRHVTLDPFPCSCQVMDVSFDCPSLAVFAFITEQVWSHAEWERQERWSGVGGGGWGVGASGFAGS